MITASYNITATERVLPKLALDFTTASLDSRVTFTRTTDATHPATYVNSSGNITAATNNQPRFDYTYATGGACKGLLIEESRTNYVLQSGFAGAAVGTPGTFPTSWTAPASSGSISAITADSLGGNILTFTVNSQRHIAQQVVSLSANTTYSATLYVHSNTGLIFDQIFYGTGAPAGSSFSYFANGVTVDPLTYVPVANDRICIVMAVGATSGSVSLRCGAGCTGNSTGTVAFSKPQIEVGAFPTSYIPTTTTALTRNADVATMTGTNFSSWFNAGNGAFGCSVLPKAASGVNPVLQCDDATTLNTIVMQGNATATEMKITTLAVLQNTLSTGTITANAQYSLCGAWSAGSNALSKSGASPATGSPVTIPTVTQARLGSDGTNYFNGWLKKVNYWPMRVTNSETQAFSK